MSDLYGNELPTSSNTTRSDQVAVCLRLPSQPSQTAFRAFENMSQNRE